MAPFNRKLRRALPLAALGAAAFMAAGWATLFVRLLWRLTGSREQ
jgi:hypothetical protein